MRKRASTSVSFLGWLAALAVLCPASGTSVLKLKTPAEECLYTQYSQHEEVARFLSALDAVSREMVVQVVGRTGETRDFPAKDLYLCILTENGVSSPEKLDRAKLTLMITASQHGNEQSAKESALEFLRDLALGDLRPLLRRVNVLVMPQCNPYGNSLDRRQNEQDLDMNRDHVKMESEGVAAMHRVFRAWMPEATLDMHEKGDDYYRVSLGCVSNINISSELQSFSRETILPEVEKALNKKNITFCEYVVTDDIEFNISTGVNFPAEMLRGRETMMRYSTVELNDGRSGPGIYETLAFIMECASRHDLPTLRERSRWQSSGLRAWAEAEARHGQEILAMVTRLRAQLLAKARVYSPDDVVHLRMEYARDPGQPRLVRKRFETPSSPVRGTLKVDKKAGETLLASELTPYPLPERVRVMEEVVTNWFPAVRSLLAVPRPLGYIIPSEKNAVVDNLLRHRIAVDLFTRDMPLTVEAYRVKAIEPADYDWLPPERIETAKETLPHIARRGDFYVSCAQPAAALIPLLLEPESQFGYICYRRFNLVPKEEDLFSIYRYIAEKPLPLVPYKDFLR